MPIIPVVNEKDEIVGSKDRAAITSGDIYRVAALWATNTAGEILLAQRAFTKQNQPGLWGPTVAGTVEGDEDYDANIKKEIGEEIGIMSCSLEKSVKMRMAGKRNYFVQWYTAVLDFPLSHFEISEEVASLRWISPEELRKEISENPSSFTTHMNEYARFFIG